MGKRSAFGRRAGDAYPTPIEAVLPLIPHLRGVRNFAEPCAGDGALIRHLESFGLCCTYTGDIATGQDALACDNFGRVPIITNPPWRRDQLHALIGHSMRCAPFCWLLFDANWANTLQSRDLIQHSSPILPIGRVRWIPGSPSMERTTPAGIASNKRTRPGRSCFRSGVTMQRTTLVRANSAARHTRRSALIRGSAPMPVASAPIETE